MPFSSIITNSNQSPLSLHVFGRRASDWVLIAFDYISVLVAFYLSLVLHYSSFYSNIPERCLYVYLIGVPSFAVLVVLLFLKYGLYRSLLYFAGYRELIRCTVVLSIAFVLGATFAFGQELTKEELKQQKREIKALENVAKDAELTLQTDPVAAVNAMKPVISNPLVKYKIKS